MDEQEIRSFLKSWPDERLAMLLAYARLLVPIIRAEMWRRDRQKAEQAKVSVVITAEKI